ncbi:hypothetical protein ROHU_008601 [Labeo rohita]|uniref:Uncharacterized protein n=1 Tax=Labeo rohita TaxID=84645 RepID=A0A498M5U7_LABRO|nr:hypothetical protein ROHU_008601 [Labeo rohita]
MKSASTAQLQTPNRSQLHLPAFSGVSSVTPVPRFLRLCCNVVFVLSLAHSECSVRSGLRKRRRERQALSAIRSTAETGPSRAAERLQPHEKPRHPTKCHTVQTERRYGHSNAPNTAANHVYCQLRDQRRLWLYVKLT